MSRHLRVLRKSGLVVETRDEQDARARVYQLRKQPFDHLQQWAQEIQGFWADQLRSFKVHAERSTSEP